MRVTEMGVIGPSGRGGTDNAYSGHSMSHAISRAVVAPSPPAVAAVAMPSMYQGAGFLALMGLTYHYLNSRGLLPWGKKLKGAELIPQIDAGTVRAKPKKVDVRVERGGAEASHVEVATKGLSSVAELGERLAEQMVTELDIEDAFKLYYVDNEGDTMLVSAHTGLRDLLYSEQITAKVDEYVPEPAPAPEEKKKKRSKESSKESKDESARSSRSEPRSKSSSKSTSKVAPKWDG